MSADIPKDGWFFDFTGDSAKCAVYHNGDHVSRVRSVLIQADVDEPLCKATVEILMPKGRVHIDDNVVSVVKTETKE